MSAAETPKLKLGKFAAALDREVKFGFASPAAAPKKATYAAAAAPGTVRAADVLKKVGLSILHQTALMAMVKCYTSKGAKDVVIEITPELLWDWCLTISGHTEDFPSKEELFCALDGMGHPAVMREIAAGIASNFQHSGGCRASTQFKLQLSEKAVFVRFTAENIATYRLIERGTKNLDKVFGAAKMDKVSLVWDNIRAAAEKAGLDVASLPLSVRNSELAAEKVAAEKAVRLALAEKVAATEETAKLAAEKEAVSATLWHTSAELMNTHAALHNANTIIAVANTMALTMMSGMGAVAPEPVEKPRKSKSVSDKPKAASGGAGEWQSVA